MEFLRVCSLISALCIVSNALAMEPCAADRFPMQEPLMKSSTAREGFIDSGSSLLFARSVCLYIQDGDPISRMQMEDFLNDGSSVETDLSAYEWGVAKKELLFEGSVNAYVACMLDSEDNVQRKRAGELFELFADKSALFKEVEDPVVNNNNEGGATYRAIGALEGKSKNDPLCQMLIGCSLVAGAGCIIALIQMF